MHLNYLGAGIQSSEYFLFFSILSAPQACSQWAATVAKGLTLVDLEFWATFSFSLQTQPSKSGGHVDAR